MNSSLSRGTRSRMSGAIRAARLATLVLLAGCAVETGEAVDRMGDSEATTDVRWEVTSEPLLSMGVVEGEEAYQFSSIRHVRTLADGRIALIDGGSWSVRVYDAEGEHLLSRGRRGDGPGEFRAPIYVEDGYEGGFSVLEPGRRMASKFDGEGSYLETSPFERPDGYSPLDQWFHEKTFVQAAVPPEHRVHVNAAVDRLPPISTDRPVRWVVLTEAAELWLTEQAPGGMEPTVWEIYGVDGRALGTIETPARFLPHEYEADRILGVYWDELDVEYVRAYGIDRPEPEQTIEAWMAGLEPVDYVAPTVPESSPEVQEVAIGMRSLMRNMQSSQEIYYADNFRYTGDLEAMALEPPEGLDLHFFGVGATGWMLIADHAEYGVRCMVVTGGPQGAPVPRGFQGQGRVLCH